MDRPEMRTIRRSPRPPITILSGPTGSGKTATAWTSLYVHSKHVDTPGCPKGLKTLFESNKLRDVERLVVVNTEGNRSDDTITCLEEVWGFGDFSSKMTWMDVIWEEDDDPEVFANKYEKIHSSVDADGKRYADDPNTVIVFDTFTKYSNTLNEFVDESKGNSLLKWTPRNRRMNKFLDLLDSKFYWPIIIERPKEVYVPNDKGFQTSTGQLTPRSLGKEEGYKSDVICMLDLRENDIMCNFHKRMGPKIQRILPLGKWTMAMLLCYAYGVDTTPVA